MTHPWYIWSELIQIGLGEIKQIAKTAFRITKNSKSQQPSNQKTNILSAKLESSAFSKMQLRPELRQVLSCESLAVFLYFPFIHSAVQVKGRHLLQILLKALGKLTKNYHFPLINGLRLNLRAIHRARVAFSASYLKKLWHGYLLFCL